MINARKTLYILALIRLVLPFLLQHAYYQPHRDEFLYLDYAKHMDWGFMEVPPVLSVFSWLSYHLGNSFFWVKIWPALFGALSFLLCGDMLLKLGGKTYGLILLFSCFVFGAFIRLFFLFQPGFLEVFSWTAIIWCLVNYQLQKQVKWLYFFGLACGIGLLSKYTTAFFITGLVGGIALSNQRNLFIKKEFYYAAIIAFLLFLPNLLWQYNHNFPVVAHMKELRETQLVYINPSEFIMGQLMMNLVVAFIWVTGLIKLLLSRKWKDFRWIGFTYFITIVLLIAGSGKDYYALGLYPALFAFGAVHFDSLAVRWHKAFKVALVAIPVALGICILPLGLPMFTPEKLANYYEKAGFREAMGFTWEDRENHPLPQDFADMMGWREIAETTAKHYNALPDSTKASTVVFCRGYYTAGALNYYGKTLGLPEAISTNGSYLWWIPKNLSFRHLMMVAHKDPDDDEIVFKHFEKRAVLDTIQLPYFRENGIRVFFFENGNDSMRYYVRERIKMEKEKFTRNAKK